MVAAAAVLPLAASLRHPLLWDAAFMVRDDPATADLAAALRALDEPAAASLGIASDRVGQLPYYRPLLGLLVASLRGLLGAAPAPWHALSLALHAAVAVVLLGVTRELLRRVDGEEPRAAARAALLGALLFAVAPGKAEAAAWVYGLGNLVLALLALLALRAWLADRPLALALLAGAAPFVREEGVLLAPLLLLAEVGLLPGRPGRLRRTGPAFAAAVAYLLLRARVVGGVPLPEAPPLALLAQDLALLAESARVLAWPPGRVGAYPARPPDALPALALAGLPLAAGLAWVLGRWRRAPLPAFALAWGLAWLLPWFDAGRFGEWRLTEKALLLPATGWVPLLGAALARRRAGRVLALALVALWGARTAARTAPRSSPTRFFEAVTAEAPDLATGWYMLGLARVEAGDLDGAARAFQAALEREPAHSLAWNNLGNCRWAQGRRAEAEAAWTRAVAADPANAPALYNLGMAAEARGDLAAARARYARYLAVAPEVPPGVAAHLAALGLRR